LNKYFSRLLRKLILLTAVNAEMSEARERAVKLYTEFRNNNVPVSPNLRWMAYSAGVRFGDRSDWKFAWDKYTNSQVPSEKSLWMRSLSDTQDTYVLLRYLDATTDRDKIRPQDVTSVLSGVARNPAGSQLAWRHIQVNWEELIAKFGTGSFIMGSIIESTTSHFSTEFDYQSVSLWPLASIS
jgi:aminopeptidase N